MTTSNDMTESQTDDLNWQDYEELVRDIHEILGREDGVEIVCWGRSCKVTGNSGTEHQIDVLTRHRAALYEYLTAIECKYLNKKVGKGDIAKLFGVVEDTNIDKGVVVSKMGFTGPARSYADAKNIGLIELRKPLDEDWDGYIREIHGTIVIDRPVIDVSLALAAPQAWEEERDLQEGTMTLSFPVDQIFVEIPDQESISLGAIIGERSTADSQNDEYQTTFPQGSTVAIPHFTDHPIHGCPITGVALRVRHESPIVHEFVVSASDRVYMIMKNVFDERRYTITNDGEIVEDNTGV